MSDNMKALRQLADEIVKGAKEGRSSTDKLLPFLDKITNINESIINETIIKHVSYDFIFDFGHIKAFSKDSEQQPMFTILHLQIIIWMFYVGTVRSAIEKSILLVVSYGGDINIPMRDIQIYADGKVSNYNYNYNYNNRNNGGPPGATPWEFIINGYSKNWDVMWWIKVNNDENDNNNNNIQYHRCKVPVGDRDRWIKYNENELDQLIQKIMNEAKNRFYTTSYDDFAIVDSGSELNLFREDAEVTDKTLTCNPLVVRGMSGHKLKTTHTCKWAVTTIPDEARKGHVLPGLKSPALISVASLCDNGCDVVFQEDKVTVYRKTDGSTLLTGIRDTRSKCWLFPLKNKQQQHGTHMTVREVADEIVKAAEEGSSPHTLLPFLVGMADVNENILKYVHEEYTFGFRIPDYSRTGRLYYSKYTYPDGIVRFTFKSVSDRPQFTIIHLQVIIWIYFRRNFLCLDRAMQKQILLAVAASGGDMDLPIFGVKVIINGEQALYRCDKPVRLWDVCLGYLGSSCKRSVKPLMEKTRKVNPFSTTSLPSIDSNHPVLNLDYKDVYKIIWKEDGMTYLTQHPYSLSEKLFIILSTNKTIKREEAESGGITESNREVERYDFSDVKIICKDDDGIIYPAHQNILSKKSLVFHTYFGGKWAESSKDEGGCCTYETEVRSEIMKYILSFVYTGNFGTSLVGMNITTTLEILEEAQFFQFDDLVDCCTKAVNGCQWDFLIKTFSLWTNDTSKEMMLRNDPDISNETIIIETLRIVRFFRSYPFPELVTRKEKTLLKVCSQFVQDNMTATEFASLKDEDPVTWKDLYDEVTKLRNNDTTRS